MNLAGLLEICRRELDDTAEPFLWDDAELIEHAVDAQNEACRRARLIVDSTTTAICTIATVIGQSVYTLDPRVIRVNRARLTGEVMPLCPMMLRDVDAQYPGWEDWEDGTPAYWIPDYETNKIRLMRPPDAVGTLNLQVVRLPLVDPKVEEDDLEIREEYQRSLRHWVLYRAWMKRDSETYNEKAAAGALALFEQEFGRKQGAYDEQWMVQYYNEANNGRY